MAMDIAERADAYESSPKEDLCRARLPEEMKPEFEPDREVLEPPEPQRPWPRADLPAPSFERPLAVSPAMRVRISPAAPEVVAEAAPAEIHNPPPDYPLQARRRALEGEALVQITILPDGGCGGARLLEWAGSPLFGEAALAAVRKWRYRPASRNGQAVAAVISVRFVFRLRA